MSNNLRAQLALIEQELLRMIPLVRLHVPEGSLQEIEELHVLVEVPLETHLDIIYDNAFKLIRRFLDREDWFRVLLIPYTPECCMDASSHALSYILPTGPIDSEIERSVYDSLSVSESTKQACMRSLENREDIYKIQDREPLTIFDSTYKAA